MPPQRRDNTAKHFGKSGPAQQGGNRGGGRGGRGDGRGRGRVRGRGRGRGRGRRDDTDYTRKPTNHNLADFFNF